MGSAARAMLRSPSCTKTWRLHDGVPWRRPLTFSSLWWFPPAHAAQRQAAAELLSQLENSRPYAATINQIARTEWSVPWSEHRPGVGEDIRQHDTPQERLHRRNASGTEGRRQQTRGHRTTSSFCSDAQPCTHREAALTCHSRHQLHRR